MGQTNSGDPEGDAPRPAATLVILRDSLRGPELLLTVRPKTMRFMGGAVVFPGGAVAAADLDARWRDLAGLTPNEAASALDLDDAATALGSYVAALREAFEEVGFALSDAASTLPRDAAESPEAFLKRFSELGPALGAGSLVAAGRWVTPLGSPLRFDARFFAVRAPQGWEPDPDPAEVDGAYWSTPAQALSALASGDSVMAPPTVEMMQRLDAYDSVDEILESLENVEWQSSGEILRMRLSPQVALVLAPNPGLLTGPGTNTYVVGSGRSLVIDPAVPDDAFLAAVTGVADELEAIVVTHRHPDHTGGVAALAERTGAPVRAYGSEPIDGIEVVPLADGNVVATAGVSLRALHTPGHASDHLCFEMVGTKSLFAGDNILGEGTAVIAPPDGNMRDYLSSLYRLRGLELERIYPGHFRPLDGGTAVIESYIEHRAERRRAVIDALETPATVEDVVRRVYTDTPARLHPIAVHQVWAMLELLEEENMVQKVNELWKLSDVH